MKNKANKTKSDVDIAVYKEQRNYVVALSTKSKYNYFNNNLDVSKGVKPFWKTFLENLFGKPFWKTCRTHFSNKQSRRILILTEKNKLILNDWKIATNFIDCFAEIVPSLNLDKASKAQLQCIYKKLPFIYLVNSLSLLGSLLLGIY